MKHVAVLVPNGETVLSSVVGPYKLFSKVNEFLKATGVRTDDFYNVQLVGLNHSLDLYGGAFSITPHITIDQLEKTDLVVIPAFGGDIQLEIQNNRGFVEWIKRQRHVHHAEVASLCMGAFILAETGLVDHKPCSTHWSAAEVFAERYPEVDLQPDKVITEDSGIYSSGGAYSFLNLILHLIEKYNGKEVALWCTKMFELDIGRENQTQFFMFQGQKGHNDQEIKLAQEYIEQHYEEKLTVDELADKFAISKRSFIRRFKKATLNTPSEYIQRVKIEMAKKNLETTDENIAQVMYGVGYSDTKAFRNVFRKYTGLSPNEYRVKYNRFVA